MPYAFSTIHTNSGLDRYFISGPSFHASFLISKLHLCPTSTIHILQNCCLTMKLGHHLGCACTAKPSSCNQRHVPDDTKSSDRIKICIPGKSPEWLPWEFPGEMKWVPPSVQPLTAWAQHLWAFTFAPLLACCTQFCPGTADLFLTEATVASQTYKPSQDFPKLKPFSFPR